MRRALPACRFRKTPRRKAAEGFAVDGCPPGRNRRRKNAAANPLGAYARGVRPHPSVRAVPERGSLLALFLMIRSVGDSLERLPAGGGYFPAAFPPARTGTDAFRAAPPAESLGKGEGPGGEPVRGLPALPKGSPRHVSPNLPPRLPGNEPVLQLIVLFHDKVVEPGDVDVRAGHVGDDRGHAAQRGFPQPPGVERAAADAFLDGR